VPCVEVMTAFLDHIEWINPAINAIVFPALARLRAGRHARKRMSASGIG
jgi:hypothetical protein